MKIKKASQIYFLYNSLKEKSIPLKTALKLNQLNEALKSSAEFFINTYRQIVNTYSLKDKNGSLLYNEDHSMILIDPEKKDECLKQLNELEELDVSCPNITFEINELEPLNLTIEQVEILSEFIKE